MRQTSGSLPWPRKSFLVARARRSTEARCRVGGGSPAWVDRGGILQAGPQSAGAEPGPACYARGGTEAAITDARVVLGH